MFVQILTESIRDARPRLLATISCTIALQETLGERRANVSAQEFQEREDHPIYAELQVKQMRIEG